MSGISERVTFTIYDIISSFLPGAVFVTGALLPFTGVGDLLIDLRLGSIVIFAIISFTTGLAFQAVGGIVSSTSDIFAQHLTDVVSDEQNETSPLGVDTSDVQFVESFRKEFNLDSEFDNWSSLYRRVVSRLERSQYQRTIRLQALQLGTRGLCVALGILALSYIGGYIIVVIPFSIEDVSVIIPPLLMPLLGVIYAAVSVAFYKRSNEYGKYSVRYMISEFLELTGSDAGR